MEDIMNAHAKELLNLREKIIKNSMLILIIQAVLLENPLVTLGYSIKRLDDATKKYLIANGQTIPNFAHYAIVAKLSQKNIWLGIKYHDCDVIWKHYFPMQHFTVQTVKRFIDFAYASYKFNAAKVDKVFSNIPNSLYPIFVDNDSDYFNYWKSGYTKKAKKWEIPFSEEQFAKYKSDLNFRLQKYQAVACVLVKISKKGACKFINCNYGELSIHYIAENEQLHIRVENYIECKSNSKVVPLSSFHPKKYDNSYIDLGDIAFYVHSGTVKGCL